MSFEQAFEQASARNELRELKFKLTHEEVLLAVEYLKKLIASRPKSPAVACKVVPIKKTCHTVNVVKGLRCAVCGEEISWVPEYPKTPSEQFQDELEPLPNAGLRHAC